MSNYWVPSATFVSASTGTTAMVVASNQVEGLARIINIGGSVAFAAIVTAGATAGAANLVPLAPNVAFFIAFGATTNNVVVTGGTCMFQPGYAIK